MDRGFEQRRCERGLIPFATASSRAWGRCLCGIGRGGALVLLSALVVAGILISAHGAGGQSAGDKELATQDVQSTFKVEVQRNMVLVRTIVRDANGRPISGLKKEDFRLFDNGKPQEIDQFASGIFCQRRRRLRPSLREGTGGGGGFGTPGDRFNPQEIPSALFR